MRLGDGFRDSKAPPRARGLEALKHLLEGKPAA